MHHGIEQGIKEGRALDIRYALDHFLSQVERRAFRMAQIATNSHHEALDIVQDAMMILVKKYSQRSETEWGALFYRILQNRIRDWYRRQKVRNAFFSWFRDEEGHENSLANFPAAPAANPEQQTTQAQMTVHLEQALHDLPVRQQQVFLLRNWEGLDVNQTAAAMGISSGSVKTHYSRAVHTLRDKLGAYRDE